MYEWIRVELQEEEEPDLPAVSSDSDIDLKEGESIHHISTNEDNYASIRVNEKCGFKLEGRMREEYLTKDGLLKDRLYFGLLKDEWKGGNDEQ